MSSLAFRRRTRAFTLAEIMIGSSLAAFIMAGVMSTFLFLGRSGANVQNYSDMESQARAALELFAEDTRQASSINWITREEIRLTVNSLHVYYHYDGSARTFYRKVGSTGRPRALVTGITNFAYTAYTLTGTSLPLTTLAELATADRSTKQLQIFLESSRNRTTLVAATNTILSARFILRNKRIAM